MRTWHLYDPATGIFDGRRFSSSDDSAIEINRRGLVAFEGDIDYLSQRVDVATGELVDYQPPSPDDDHEWIHDDDQGHRVRRWVLKPEAIEQRARQAVARSRIAELGRKTERATREFLLGIVPTVEDRAAGAMTLQEIENELAQLRLEVNGE